MNRTTHLFTKLVALATIAMGTLLLTAGHAAAQHPIPGPGGTGSAPGTSGGAPARPIIDASVSALQWTLFAVAVLGALAVGAALMNVVQRRRSTLRITGDGAAAR